MPIYEYRCQSCGHELEAIQKIADAPLRDCPACGEADLKKKISAPAFRLKGGGWYETDFKSKDKQRNVIKAEEKPADGAKKDDKKEAAKPAEAKPSAKGGTKEAAA